MGQGKLRVALGDGPLRAEHERLLRTALKRGSNTPERTEGETIDTSGYSPRALEIARATWLARMVHEHHSSAVFSRLLPQLIEAEATLDLKTSVLRMAMDELRHAGLCGGVVEALGGTAEVTTSLTTEPLPDHPNCTAREIALRNVLFVGCLSETVSIALLHEEHALAKEPLIARVLEQLAADEVLHAKLGWAFLAETWPLLDAAARERTERYLPVALRYLEEKMLAAMPLARDPIDDALRAELRALGVTPADDARELYRETVGTVIRPQLAAHGLTL
jgi:hypothetical protein